MKSFSFKILYISIFAPSIFYILTLPYFELWSRHDITRALRQGLIRQDFDLLQGNVSLYDEVNNNVESTLRDSSVVRLGAQVRVRITDLHENVIYPYYEHLISPLSEEGSFKKRLGPLFDENGFARNSQRGEVEDFLQQYSDYIHGMKIMATVQIPVTSWLGSGLLLLYILLTVTILYTYYQWSSRLEEKRVREIEERLEKEKRTVEQVEWELQEGRRRLADIKSQEDEWLQEMERLEREKVTLEEELLETLEQSEEQKEKIDTLEEKVVKETGNKSKGVKEAQSLSHRFTRLYRNLEIDPRAVEDLVRFRDEKLKLQAEEVLKRLNDADPSLKIRRKIAGVEKCDAFELGFGSSGRIYYISSEIRRFKVLRIGTKASQKKDLAFLQKKS